MSEEDSRVLDDFEGLENSPLGSRSVYKSACRYGPLPPGVVGRLLGGSDVDSDNYDLDLSIELSSSSSEDEDLLELEVDEQVPELVEEIEIAVKDLDVDGANAVDADLEKFFDDNGNDLIEIPLLDMSAYVLESVDKMQNLSKDSLIPEEEDALKKEAVGILNSIKEQGYKSVDIVKALEIRDKLELAVYNSAKSLLGQEIRNATTSKQMSKEESYARSKAKGAYQDIGEQIKQLNVRMDVLTKNADNIRKASSINVLRQNLEEIVEKKADKSYVEKARTQFSDKDIRNAIVDSAKFSQLIENLVRVEKSREKHIDKDAFWFYSKDNPEVKDAKELLDKAFEEQLQCMLLRDPLTDKFKVSINKDKIQLTYMEKSALNKLQDKSKLSDKIDYVERDRLMKAYGLIKDQIERFTDTKGKRNAASKKLIEKFSKMIPKNFLSKPKNRYEAANKKQIAKDIGVKFKEEPKSGKLVSKIAKVEKDSKSVQAIYDLANQIKEKNKDKTRVEKQGVTLARRTASALNQLKVDDKLRALNLRDKDKKEIDKITKQAIVEVRRDNLKSAIERINSKNKEGVTEMRSRRDARCKSERHGLVVPSVAPKGKTISKIGKHSVGVNGVVAISFDAAAANIGQNVFAATRARIYDARNRISFNQNSFTWEITSRIHTPITNMQMRTYEYSHSWDRFYCAGDDPIGLEIGYSTKIIKDSFDIASASEYVRDKGVALTKPIAEGLQSEFRMIKSVAEQLAPLFTYNLDRHNNSAFFTQLVLLAMQVHDLEMAGIQWRVHPNVTRARLTHVNVHCQPNEIKDMVDAFAQANVNGTLVLRGKYISNAKLTILAMMSVGMKSVYIQNAGIQHVYNRFDFELPSFMIVHEGIVPEMFQVEQSVPSDMIWKFAIELAKQLRMHADFVEGVNNAMRIGFGVIRGAGNRPVYFTSTLESRKILLPRPHFHNCLWDILKKEPQELPCPLLEGDFTALASMDIDELQLSGTLMSSMMSSAVSTNLNMQNYTGTQINDLHAQEIISRHSHINLINYISVQRGCDRAAIFVDMCSTMTQTYGLSMNSSCFRYSSWSNSMQFSVPLFGNDQMWMIEWANRVPYLFDPIVMLPYAQGLPEVWGLSLPKMSLDWTRESTVTGSDDTQAWWARTGDTRYDANLKARTASGYVSYGLFCINFLIEHTPLGINEPFDICFESRIMNGSEPLTQEFLHGRYQPQFDFRIPHVIPGTLLTYDWTRNCQLTPYIQRAALPYNIFEVLAASHTIESIYAGVASEVAPTHSSIVSNVNQGISFPGMEIFSERAPGSGNRFGRSEN